MQVSTLICRSNLYLDMIFCGRCSCFGEQYRQIVCILREDDIYERSLNFARSNEMSLSITLVLNDTMYVAVFVIRKLKSLSLSLFGIDIGYGNKLLRLRQGDEIKQDSKGTRSSFKFISQQCFYYFFMLALLIVHENPSFCSFFAHDNRVVNNFVQK